MDSSDVEIICALFLAFAGWYTLGVMQANRRYGKRLDDLLERIEMEKDAPKPRKDLETTEEEHN